MKTLNKSEITKTVGSDYEDSNKFPDYYTHIDTLNRWEYFNGSCWGTVSDNLSYAG